MSDKEEWCVWEKVGGDLVERCLVRIQCNNGFAAYMSAISWAKKRGYSGDTVTIDGPPRETARGRKQICYDRAPVERPSIQQVETAIEEYFFKKWALSA